MAASYLIFARALVGLQMKSPVHRNLFSEDKEPAPAALPVAATPKTKPKGRPKLTPDQKQKQAADWAQTLQDRKTDYNWVYGITVSTVALTFKDDSKRPPEIKSPNDLVVMKVGQCVGYELFERFGTIESSWSSRRAVLPAPGATVCKTPRLNLKTGGATNTSVDARELLVRSLRHPTESGDLVFAMRVKGQDNTDSLEKYG